MAFLIGIDEAGFGPLLGPLIVSSACFQLPEHLLQRNLWRLLKKSIAKTRRHLSGRLLIADSKKARTKAQPIKHLQRTVLACLKSLNKNPTSLVDLLRILSPDVLDRLSSYPWYRNIQNHPLIDNSADITIASEVFLDDMAAKNITLTDISSRCLDVAYFNTLIESVNNKASVLFTATAQLIQNAWQNYSHQPLHIIVDRQGGRTRYRPVLQTIFPAMQMRILKETPSISSYELTSNRRQMRIHFVVSADDRFLPVSLASMASKFLRELLVHNINRYFQNLHPQIKPTAGYWKDGQRFLADLKQLTPAAEYDSTRLVRCR